MTNNLACLVLSLNLFVKKTSKATMHHRKIFNIKSKIGYAALLSESTLFVGGDTAQIMFGIITKRKLMKPLTENPILYSFIIQLTPVDR